MRQAWCVIVWYKNRDEASYTYGPYTQLQAERVAAQIEKEIEISETDAGEILHPYTAFQVIAVPMSQYRNLLPGNERIRLRARVRKQNKDDMKAGYPRL